MQRHHVNLLMTLMNPEALHEMSSVVCHLFSTDGCTKNAIKLTASTGNGRSPSTRIPLSSIPTTRIRKAPEVLATVTTTAPSLRDHRLCTNVASERLKTKTFWTSDSPSNVCVCWTFKSWSVTVHSPFGPTRTTLFGRSSGAVTCNILCGSFKWMSLPVRRG